MSTSLWSSSRFFLAREPIDQDSMTLRKMLTTDIESAKISNQNLWVLFKMACDWKAILEVTISLLEWHY